MAVTAVVVCLLSLALTVSAESSCTSMWCIGDLPIFSGSKPLPIEDLIKNFGYPVEVHEIKTEDNYYLTYHRIPYGKDSSSTPGKPVLLQHGILASSSCWVLSEQALAFTLADAGFDVWLGNARGNTYSKKHVHLDPEKDEKEFWNFSWHEMGVYDLPASIDYILFQTGHEKLFYIGHSMGTTMYCVLGAMKPQYMDKIETSVLLAPVVYPWHIKSPVARFLKAMTASFYMVVEATGNYEISPLTENTLWIDEHVCSHKLFKFICKEVIDFFGGYEENHKRTPVGTVLEYMPAGTSYKTFRHFSQTGKEGRKFQQYDYGLLRNLWMYSSTHPPLYDLSTVNAPLYVYYATNDWLAVPEDALYAVDRLPNVKKVINIPDEFNHFDFMWANDAKSLVYDDIVAVFQGRDST